MWHGTNTMSGTGSLLVMMRLPDMCCSISAGLVAEDFELLQLYAENFQPGGALAQVIKAARAAKKDKESSSSKVQLTAAAGSDVVMVAASALAAQVYPDSRYDELKLRLQMPAASLLVLVEHVQLIFSSLLTV